MKKTAALSVLVVAVLLAVVVIAQPQQQKKIPRIGYLAGNILNVDIRLDAFRQGLRQLGYTERKDIVIESRSADGKLDRLNELAADLVRLKVDVIVTRGCSADTRRQSGNGHNPHCYDAGPRSRGQRVRREPSAPRWKHYGIIKSCPRDKRQATGASEGDHS